MSHQHTIELYPRYCFHLSPTWNTWCFFKAADLHALAKPEGFEGENFYFHDKLPIKWVRVVGLIVAVDDYAGRRVYTIDDSSGACIETHETLTAPKRDGQPAASSGAARPLVPPKAVSAYPEVDVGMVVDVKGKLADFRDERQINLERMKVLRCTQEEVSLWEKRARFKRDVLDEEWVVDKRDLRRARKEAEREVDSVARRKKKREAERMRRGAEEMRQKQEDEDRIKERKRRELEGMRLAMAEDG